MTASAISGTVTLQRCGCSSFLIFFAALALDSIMLTTFSIRCAIAFHAEHYWQDLGTEHRLAVSGEVGKHRRLLPGQVPNLGADIFVCVQWANLIGKAPKS